MILTALGAALLFRGHIAVTDDFSSVAKSVAESAIYRFSDKDLKAEQIAVSVLRVQDGASCDFRGEEAMYPASVVKLFYLVYLADQIERGRIKKTEEVERGARDMIVKSDNDATNWILEILTGAVSGPELEPAALKRWMARRQAVNRFFEAKGFRGINASQKTWYSGPYGRERQGYGPNFEQRNSLSPNHCTRLLGEIMQDKAAKPASCAWMRGFLHREIPADSDKADSQSKGYTGEALPKGSKLWSKAGWTSSVKHDVACVQTPDGRRYVWAIFTKDQANVEPLIPFIASELVKRLF